jgi:hypothetical protein
VTGVGLFIGGAIVSMSSKDKPIDVKDEPTL